MRKAGTAPILGRHAMATRRDARVMSKDGRDPGVRRASGVRIVFRIEDPRWRGVDMKALRRVAKLAQERTGIPGDLTVLLTTDAQLCALNTRHRGKPTPTNVLAFPAGREAGGYLGDIAVAYGVAAEEASASGKRLNDHAAHLVVHGVLHLMGYDHQTARDARRMEGLEVDILHEMGIADPYGGSIAAE